MKKSEHNHKLCPIAKSMSILGDSWSILILRNCFMGTCRFEGFQRELGITRHLLTSRLNSMVEQGVLSKRPVNRQQTRFEYYLTTKGNALRPVLMAMATWGNEWLSEGEPTIHYLHNSCGKITRPTMCCNHCGGSLENGSVKVQITENAKEKIQKMKYSQLAQEFGFIP